MEKHKGKALSRVIDAQQSLFVSSTADPYHYEEQSEVVISTLRLDRHLVHSR